MSRARRGRRAPGRAATAGVLAAAVLLTGALALAGQEGYREPSVRERWLARLSAGGIIPVGGFMSNMGHMGGNLSLAVGWRLADSPFLLTFDCSIGLLGLHTYHDYLSGTIPVRVEVTTTNNLLQGLVGLRFQPWSGHARPYIEGLAGFNYLFTETSVYQNDYPWDEIASDTNYDSGAPCGGFGAGVDFVFRGNRPILYGTGRTVYRLDLNVRYLFGGRAKYLRGDSIVYRDGYPVYLYRDSNTSLINFQVGIAAGF